MGLGSALGAASRFPSPPLCGDSSMHISPNRAKARFGEASGLGARAEDEHLNARYASPSVCCSNRKNLCLPRFRDQGEIFTKSSSGVLFLLAQPRFGVIPVERFRIG